MDDNRDTIRITSGNGDEDDKNQLKVVLIFQLKGVKEIMHNSKILKRVGKKTLYDRK